MNQQIKRESCWNIAFVRNSPLAPGAVPLPSFELFRTGTLNAIQPVEEPDARGDGHIENHPSEFNLPLLNLTAA